MRAEVAVIESDVTVLEGLDPASREIAITQLLGQAKQFMEVAMQQPDAPRVMADFKAQIITIAEYAKQKRMSEELQIDATVMVRRSERGLGVAIREGQELGTVETKSESAARAAAIREVKQGRMDRDSFTNSIPDKPKPTDFAKPSELSGTDKQPGIYMMTDNISESQFEKAIADAVADQNVSRANVARKLRGEPPAPKLRKTTPVLSRAMDGISGYRMALEEIHSIDEDLTPEQAQAWVKEIGRTISELGRIRNLVKETAK